MRYNHYNTSIVDLAIVIIFFSAKGAVDGKIFIMRQDLASELQDIEDEIRQLNNKDYFTNKIFK